MTKMAARSEADAVREPFDFLHVQGRPRVILVSKGRHGFEGIPFYQAVGECVPKSSRPDVRAVVR